MSRYKIAGIHVVVWACFIAYEVFVAKQFNAPGGFWDFADFYFLDICLFYFNAEVVFRFAQTPKKVALVLTPLILVELTLFSILSLGVGLYLFKSQTGWSYQKIVSDDIVRATWRGIYIAGLSTGYAFFKRTIFITKEANKLKILQLETENNLARSKVAYLQLQINPHFLYNTLSYIYNSTEQAIPETAKAILMLSDIMRYALKETGEDGKVPLADEIVHIERYVNLTQLRFSNSLSLNLKINIANDCGTCRIPPLILLTFIENIFKHGNLTEKEDPAQITIDCQQQVLYLTTTNRKRKSTVPLENHIGIANVETRLKLYAKEDVDLAISETATHFIVALRIKL